MKQFKLMVLDSLVNMSVCFSLKNTLELNGTTYSHNCVSIFITNSWRPSGARCACATHISNHVHSEFERFNNFYGAKSISLKS